MKNILYYPYINIPRTDWTLRTLLYYDNIGAIVPQEYFYNPERNYEPFMLDLVRNQLVTPIDPLEIFDNPWEVTKPFIQMIEDNVERLKQSQLNFRTSENSHTIHANKFLGSKIHADKFDQNVFYELEQLDLAKRGEGRWYIVEKRTASNLMKFLATLISAKTKRLPTTDYIKQYYTRSSFHNPKSKRETILTRLIPFPEEINLDKLTRFKERHSGLLTAFQTKVELIALDPKIIDGTPLFHLHLSELVQQKEELSSKMQESGFSKILYGTVFGLIGAGIGVAGASTTTAALVGALPGFANAVYSALQIEKAENMFDQSGLKYLALADKRLRQ